MATTSKIHLYRDAGHPWDCRMGFDLMYIDAQTQADLDASVALAETKFWKVWASGVNEGSGLPGAVCFKPSGISVPWHDSPESPYQAPDQ